MDVSQIRTSLVRERCLYVLVRLMSRLVSLDLGPRDTTSVAAGRQPYRGTLTSWLGDAQRQQYRQGTPKVQTRDSHSAKKGVQGCQAEKSDRVCSAVMSHLALWCGSTVHASALLHASKSLRIALQAMLAAATGEALLEP